jgi:hypothetical protein
MNMVSWLDKLFLLVHYQDMVFCMINLDIILYQLHRPDILVHQMSLIYQGKLVMVDILTHSLGLLEMV